MRIIGGEEKGSKSYRLIRRIALFRKDVIKVHTNDKNAIDSIIDSIGYTWNIGNTFEFQYDNKSIFRTLKEFEEADNIYIIHFTRTTNAYRFLLPLCDFEDKDKVFNAFIFNDKLIIHITNSIDGGYYLKTMDKPFYKNKYNKLYYANIRNEFIKDYTHIMNSKYSYISENAIAEIEKFHSSNDVAVMAAKKDKRLIAQLMERYAIYNELFFKKNDVELLEKMNMNKETMTGDDLINDENAKEIKNEKVKRNLPFGVIPIEDAIARGLDLPYGDEDDI